MQCGFQNVQTLVELAALTAYHGNTLLTTQNCLSRSGIESYWLASRNRMDAWAVDLKQLESSQASNAPVSLERWKSIESLNEEIMISEVLTRLWVTIGCEVDKRAESNEAEPFVRSVFHGHIDSRHRLMRLVFEKLNLSAVQARKADKIRRMSEKWTDILLGFLDHSCDTAEFAFERDRVTDFAKSIRGQEHPDMAQSMLMVSLKSAFREGFSDQCPNPGYNRQIAASVLSCFSPDVFDSVGIFKSLWQTRLANVAKDTQGMLDTLIADHRSTNHTAVNRLAD